MYQEGVFMFKICGLNFLFFFHLWLQIWIEVCSMIFIVGIRVHAWFGRQLRGLEEYILRNRRLEPYWDWVYRPLLDEKYFWIHANVGLHGCGKLYLSFVIFVLVDKWEEGTCSDVETDQTHCYNKFTFS